MPQSWVRHYIQGWYSCNPWSLLCKLALRYTHLSTFRVAVDEQPPTTHLRPKALYEMCMCRCQDRPWFRIQDSPVKRHPRSSNIHIPRICPTQLRPTDAMAQIGFALGEICWALPVDISDWGPHGLACLTLGVFTGFTNSWDVSWQKEKGGESFWKGILKKRWGEWDLNTLWTKRLQKIWWWPPKSCIEFILNGINSMYKLQNWSGLGGFVFQHWLLNPLIFTQSLDSLDTSPLSGVFSSQDGPSEASTVSQHIQLMVYRIRDSTSWYGKFIYSSTSSSYFTMFYMRTNWWQARISAPSTGDFVWVPPLQDSQSRLILTPRRSRSPISPSPRKKSQWMLFWIGQEVDDWMLIVHDTAMKI